MKRFLRDLSAATASLTVLVLMESFTGITLESLKHRWMHHPEFLAMLPALMDFRGNVALAHSARTATATHLGDEEKALQSSLAVLLVGLMVPPVIGLVVYYAYGGDLSTLVGAAFLTVLSVTAVVTPVTVGIVRVAAMLGFDPDHVAPPLTTALSDVLTVVLLFTIAEVMVG
ncbi:MULTISPECIES: magnesium transporter [unclassified Methanopyrus]|uniref:magnesium transporter n=1 Tax=Methanopyrus sp. SNP6 TaxID=1937005 RepID=UPI0011E5C4D5|nr:magnesium transporter [Methanopyrus sp. SNP6]